MNDFDKFQRLLRGEKLPDCTLPVIPNPDAPNPCIEYVKPKSKRGGKREGAGRPQLSLDCATVHIDISMPADLHNKARSIGNGNVSEGVRIALDYFPI
jgi:hypothetical protein